MCTTLTTTIIHSTQRHHLQLTKEYLLARFQTYLLVIQCSYDVAMEHDLFQMEIFHSHVQLPEDILVSERNESKMTDRFSKLQSKDPVSWHTSEGNSEAASNRLTTPSGTGIPNQHWLQVCLHLFGCFLQAWAKNHIK